MFGGQIMIMINSFEEFSKLEILRENNYAKIVLYKIKGFSFKLVGFEVSSSLSNKEIYKIGWEYYQNVQKEFKKLKNGN